MRAPVPPRLGVVFLAEGHQDDGLHACAEAGINAQAFAVTFGQVGTFEPITIGITSQGICLLLLWPLPALTRSESAWVVRVVILDTDMP